MQPSNNKKNNRSNGNILFMLLISIGLFAALSYTIARSSRTVSYSVDSDYNARVQEIITYAEKVSSAIARLRFENDCKASMVSFSQEDGDDYTNPNAPSSHKCDVFNYLGGGIKALTPPDTILDEKHKTDVGYGEYIYTGNICVDKIGTGVADGCASDSVENEELLVIVPWVKQNVCEIINGIMKNPNMPEDEGSSFDGTKFTGTLEDGFALNNSKGTMYNIGCFSSSSIPGEGYHFYYTLIEK